jgi:heptosyltransferase-2
MASRPKSLIIHHRSGIGDLVWHIPYFRAIAEQSADGRASLVSRPSARAADLLAAEHWLDQHYEFDRRPQEGRNNGHGSLTAQWAFARLLRQQKFDRVYIFASRPRYAVLACLAGIPERYGFGFHWTQRLWLNQPPYIEAHRGEGSWVYPEATAFALAHKLVDAPQIPRMSVLSTALEQAEQIVAGLPRSRVAFAIGASNPAKNWGEQRFGELARHLTGVGLGVVLLGGPAEQSMAVSIRESIDIARREQVLSVTQPSLQLTAALLRQCDYCIGNDTGVLNMAAANEVPALGLFGITTTLTHDPLVAGVQGRGMDAITVPEVMLRLRELAPELLANFDPAILGQQ